MLLFLFNWDVLGSLSIGFELLNLLILGLNELFELLFSLFLRFQQLIEFLQVLIDILHLHQSCLLMIPSRDERSVLSLHSLLQVLVHERLLQGQVQGAVLVLQLTVGLLALLEDLLELIVLLL